MSLRPGVHWQLVFFSAIALLHGVGYSLRFALQAQGALPAGIDELPTGVLILEILAWVLVGGYGFIAAAVVRRGFAMARAGIGVVCFAWAGAFLYGWAVQDHPYEWFAALHYLFIAGAVMTPPIWQVKVKAHNEP